VAGQVVVLLWLTLIFPHDCFVLVKLRAGRTHDAVLLATYVAAVRRFNGHLGMGTELENERLWSGLVCIDAAIAFHRPVLAIVT